MKNLKRILTLSFLLLLVVEYSNAQEIELSKYKFGEGLNFSGKDNNYNFEISGYLQPSSESRKYLDNDDATFYNRMRMRRARLQFSGNSKKEKLTQFHMDIASSIQKVTEEVMIKLAKAIREEYKINNLCLYLQMTS